jgi:hypothetical protein
MTYKELLLQLQQLTEEQLNEDVCLYHDYDYYQSDVELVSAAQAGQWGGVNHPIICF